jgi:hypothetical protein
MPATYPSGTWAAPTINDSRTATPNQHATDLTDANNEIVAIETELGANPSGAAATVVARLDTLDTTVAGKYAPGGTDVAVADGGTGASTAAGARTNLGVAIGSDVQAYDGDLAAIAALVSAADKLPYATGAGTWTLADFTAAGRALVDDANAAAQRTTLGLGTMAVESATLGGDVSGTPSAVSVVKLQGRTMTADAPASGDSLVWNGTAWDPGTPTVADPPTVQILARQILK